MRFTKAQVQEAIATIYNKIAAGRSDKEIMAIMGLAGEDYVKLKQAMLDAKADEIRAKPREHVYVEYMLNQAVNITDLTTMIDDFHTSKQYNAMVGAIRARAEIYDKLIAKGQEFGLIKKEPERKEIMAGILVAEMTNQQLRKAIVGQLAGLDRLMKTHGDKTLLEIPAPVSLHHGPSLPAHKEESIAERKLSKTVRANTSKVRKGRKVKAPPAPITIEIEGK